MFGELKLKSYRWWSSYALFLSCAAIRQDSYNTTDSIQFYQLGVAADKDRIGDEDELNEDK